jgi:hypothetical protein
MHLSLFHWIPKKVVHKELHMLLHADDPGDWLDPKPVDHSAAPRPDIRFRWKQKTCSGVIVSKVNRWSRDPKKQRILWLLPNLFIICAFLLFLFLLIQDLNFLLGLRHLLELTCAALWPQMPIKRRLGWKTIGKVFSVYIYIYLSIHPSIHLSIYLCVFYAPMI